MKPFNLPWTRRSKAIVTGIGLALAVLLSGNWWSIYVHHVPNCRLEHCVADFVIFYAQPLMLRENPHALYDLDQQLVYQQRFVPTDRVLIFPYPPITAALLTPLTLLSFSGAFLAMTVLNAILLYATLRRLVRELGLARDQTQWLVISTLCNFGILATLSNSHISIVVLYILTCHLLAQRKQHDVVGGLWAGMLSVKLQYLALPHFVLLLQGARRSLFTGVALAILLISGPFVLLGSHGFLQYVQILRRYSGSAHDWTNPLQAMHNLRALTGVWLPPPWDVILWLAGTVAVLSAVIWINQNARKGFNGFEICWIGNSIALLLLSPHLFTHDLSLLVVPAALALRIAGAQVPLWLGLSLVAVGILPAINYLLPTASAALLVILFVLSLRLTRTSLARI